MQIECPYCKRINEFEVTDFGEGEHVTECSSCRKDFVVRVEMDINLYVEELSESCEWVESDTGFDSACGKTFQYTDCFSEADFKFCPYCGKPFAVKNDE